MRLLVQPRPGDWTSVVDAVGREIDAFFDDQGETIHGQPAESVGARLLG